MLLTGYSALIGGVLCLGIQPIVSVLLMLGGMALSLCSATEIVQERSGAAPPGKRS
jgi:hypothetical protein